MARTLPPSTGDGVRFPVADGARSTLATGRAVVAAAAGAVDAPLAARIAATADWRTGYVAAFRDLTAATGASPAAARAVAEAGLAALHDRLVVARDDEERPLAQAAGLAARRVPEVAVVRGAAARVRELVVPFRGAALRGDGLRRAAAGWVARGLAEPGFAAALDEVVAHPEWLALEGRRVAVVGAGAELGPLSALTAWGAHVLAVDVPAGAVWDRILAAARAGAGTVAYPAGAGPAAATAAASPGEIPGLDVVAALPETRAWLEASAGDDGLVLGGYAYADGGDHVLVSAAVDALAAHLTATRPGAAVAHLATPTDAFLVGPDVVAAARERWDARGLLGIVQAPVRRATGGRLFAPGYARPPAGDWDVADVLVPQQGPNYALAKRVQRWRGVVERAAGRPVSVNVAPSSWTRSVTKNRVLAAAFAGAPRFGVEIFPAETTRVLMAALLVRDLHRRGTPDPGEHPEARLACTAAHGGLWRAGYDPRSVLGIAAVAGLPRTLLRGGGGR